MNPATPSGPATATEAITTWLQPLQPVLDPGGQIDWRRLAGVAEALDRVLTHCPVGADLQAGAERSRRLRAIRQDLAYEPVVCVECETSTAFIEDEPSIKAYGEVVRALSESSLDELESTALIAGLGELQSPLEEAA